MRLRWLFGNFADPEYKLGSRAEHEVSSRAHERYMPTGRLVCWSLGAIVLPALLLLEFALPLVLDWLGLTGRNMPYFVGTAFIVLLVWLLSAWIYGHLYVKPVRRAMRDRGIDLCVGCGYILDNLPDDVLQCPECGHRREAPIGGHGHR